MALNEISTGYKPEFALGGLYQGINAANAQSQNNEELARMFLANQREQQMQPMDVNIKRYDEALANAKRKSPDYIPAQLSGQIGQMQTQEAAGKTASATWSNRADATNVENKGKSLLGGMTNERLGLINSGQGGMFQFGGGSKPLLAPTNIQPNSINSDLAIVKQIESGGRRYGKNGQLLTSPKGALGEMQVMPATSRNPGFGVSPVGDDSPEELARVGQEYFLALQQKYPDDAMKPFAAYNMGPGALDAIIEKWGDKWQEHLPKETRQYLMKVVTLRPQGTGNILNNFNPQVRNIAQGPDNSTRIDGFTPGSNRYEQLTWGLADTPELRSKLVTGDQARDSQDYKTIQLATAQEENAKLKRDKETTQKLNEQFAQHITIATDTYGRYSPEQKAQSKEWINYYQQTKAANSGMYSPTFALPDNVPQRAAQLRAPGQQSGFNPTSAADLDSAPAGTIYKGKTKQTNGKWR